MEKEVLNLILVEVREMKGDMSEVKERLTNLENDMSEVKGRLTNLENDMSEVKRRLTNVENDISEVKARLQTVEELAEFNKETSQSIKNVVVNHYMEFKKHVKLNKTQHNLYDAKLLKFNKEN